MHICAMSVLRIPRPRLMTPAVSEVLDDPLPGEIRLTIEGGSCVFVGRVGMVGKYMWECAMLVSGI